MVVSVRSEAVENGKCSFLYEPNRSKMNKKNVIIGSLLPEKKNLMSFWTIVSTPLKF
jgi:hypothetical protein